MKGSWIIELDRQEVLQNISPIQHNVPDSVCIPLGFSVITEEEYLALQKLLDVEIDIYIEGEIVISGMQLIKCLVPTEIIKCFSDFNYPAKSQCAVVSYERLIDVDVLFQEIEIEKDNNPPISINGRIKCRVL